MTHRIESMRHSMAFTTGHQEAMQTYSGAENIVIWRHI